MPIALQKRRFGCSAKKRPLDTPITPLTITTTTKTKQNTNKSYNNNRNEINDKQNIQKPHQDGDLLERKRCLHDDVGSCVLCLCLCVCERLSVPCARPDRRTREGRRKRHEGDEGLPAGKRNERKPVSPVLANQARPAIGRAMALGGTPV